MKPLRVLELDHHMALTKEQRDEQCAWVDAAGGDHKRTWQLELLGEGQTLARMHRFDDNGDPIVIEGTHLEIAQETRVLLSPNPCPHWPTGDTP